MLPIVIGIGAIALIALALSGKKDEPRALGLPRRRGRSDPNLTLRYARKWAPVFVVPIQTIMTIAHQESSHNPKAIGPPVARRGGVRAYGLMQQMEDEAGEKVGRILGTYGTFPEVQATARKWKGNPNALLDPDLNMMISTWQLGKLHRKFGGDLGKVAAAYHGGAGVFKKGIGPKGREYIARAEALAPLYRGVA